VTCLSCDLRRFYAEEGGGSEAAATEVLCQYCATSVLFAVLAIAFDSRQSQVALLSRTVLSAIIIHSGAEIAAMAEN
jgi:hypothetical protein